MALANQLDKDCSFQSQRYAPPQVRLLKDFGIKNEGYGIFCEVYRTYRGILQTGIIAFARLRRLQKKDIGKDAILFEKD